MNLTALINAVYTETNRPDLVPETLQAVLESTLTIHTLDNFYKDILEAQIVFDNPTNYIQTLETDTLPFYRNMAYIRKFNPVLNQVEQNAYLLPNNFCRPATQFSFLKRVDIGDILDNYGYEKQDVYYQAGNQVNIKSSTQLQYCTFGYYAYPQVDIDNGGANFDSWIAAEMPYTIIYKAAGSVFAKIGEDKSWAIYMRLPNPNLGEESGGLFYQQMAILRRNNIRAEG